MSDFVIAGAKLVIFYLITKNKAQNLQIYCPYMDS